MNNDTIDSDELFYNCNYQLLKDREIEAVKNNILEQHLPAHYHTEENIEYFKWKMEWLFKYSIIGMKNILRWQSQNDSWLDVVVDFLFHIKRNFKGITLTTKELQTLANFAAMVLNINGNSVSSFVNAFYKIFGNNVKIDIDTTNKTQTLFLYDENLSENFIRALIENNLCPILVDYSFNILKLDNDSCFFTLRSLEDENLDSMQVDFDIYFEGKQIEDPNASSMVAYYAPNDGQPIDITQQLLDCTQTPDDFKTIIQTIKTPQEAARFFSYENFIMVEIVNIIVTTPYIAYFYNNNLPSDFSLSNILYNTSYSQAEDKLQNLSSLYPGSYYGFVNLYDCLSQQKYWDLCSNTARIIFLQKTGYSTIFNLKDNYQDLLKQFPLKHTCSFRDMRYTTTEEQDKIFKCWQWYPYHFMYVNI